MMVEEYAMKQVEIISGGTELLDDVEPLWAKLNEHHKKRSTHFSHKFEQLTFEKRKQNLLKEACDVTINLIVDQTNNAYVGYCICTVNKEKQGEIDSLFIEKEYRKYGLGAELINRSITWLENHQAQTIVIGVSEGNEHALDFYQKFGFYKRRYILERE